MAKRDHPLHGVWANMKQRCSDRGHKDYPYYGGRGIRVCASWLGVRGFEAFVKCMSPRLPGTTLDRIDVNGPYSPANCRWADRKTQMRNTRGVTMITHEGKTQTLTEWAEELGIPRPTLSSRLNRDGLDFKEASRR